MSGFSLKDLILESAEKYGNQPAVKYLDKNQIIEKSYIDLKEDMLSITSYFIKNNICKKNIAIISSVSYEWIAAYYGIVSAKNVVVPIDTGLHKTDMIKLMNQADIEFLFFDRSYEKEVNEFEKDVKSIKQCVPMYSKQEEKDIWNLIEEGKKDKREVDIEENDLATIIFTSGTTGDSKGVMLSHKNIWDDMMVSYYLIGKNKNEAIVPVLPVHHMFEFTTGIQTPIYVGTPICIGKGVKYLSQSMQIYKPTILVLVPMVVEMLHKKVWMEVRKKNKEKKLKKAMKLCTYLLKVGIDLRRFFFKEIMDTFGGRLSMIISGGAPLDESLVDEFKCFGITLLNGYGISECSPVVSCNTTDKYRKKSVGCALKEYSEVKTVGGEIWVRGSIVMQGYYKDDKATQEAFENGWFKTGDLGYVDKDGFIFITGRKKNLIILENGENVSVEELEKRFSSIPHIKEMVVYAKKSKYGKQIAAIVVLEEEARKPEKINEVKQEIETKFKEINGMMPAYKRVNLIEYQDEEFEKTTSGKIKRKKFIDGNA